MQAVGAVVQRQRILLPVERKSPCGDTIAVTADGGAEEPLSGLIDVSAEIVVPQHDVREIAVAVGTHNSTTRPPKLVTVISSPRAFLNV